MLILRFFVFVSSCKLCQLLEALPINVGGDYVLYFFFLYLCVCVGVGCADEAIYGEYKNMPLYFKVDHIILK